jgi:hypothetical protein
LVSAGLLLSVVLSGVMGGAGVGCFLSLSFLDVAGFALSGVASCDWFGCATARGIVNAAKSRAIEIFMLVSGRKRVGPAL